MNAEEIEQNYNVEVRTSARSGRIVSEWWTNALTGEPDRPGDLPARTEYDEETGIISMQWWRDGKRQREDDKPSMIKIAPKTGVWIVESHLAFNEFHRVGDKPATIFRDEQGRTKEVSYWHLGKLHRSIGPAKIKYDPVSGDIVQQEFWRHGIQVEFPENSSELDFQPN
ncbi:hypothetical protein A8B75_18640 [Sphingomonadales bacterium EhC05]|nr:hypothetical protein A8B75_18640 [Sphingomonadales bacterium EhC05]